MSQLSGSQSLSQNPPQQQSQQPPAVAIGGKRSFSAFADDAPTVARPPPALRRTNKTTKPTSFADIRKTLSEIIGKPDSIAETVDLSSSDEQSDNEEGDDSEARNNVMRDLSPHADNNTMAPTSAPGSNSRRTLPNPTRTTVIDRMALKRNASSSLQITSDRLAFQAPSLHTSTSFRKPSLLRRATTNSNAESMQERAQSGGAGGKEAVKMGGSKKSSVNYYVREKERMEKVEIVERKRREGRERVGRMRRVGSGLRDLVGGGFE